MIRRIIAIGVSATALALSLPVEAQDDAAATPAYVDPEPMAFPGWGFDPAQLDTAARPGDDFFAYVNGKWQIATEIPPQYASYGVGLNLQLGAERQVRAIVEELAARDNRAGSLEQRIADTYESFLDTAAIDAAGMAPARPYLDRIAGAADNTALLALMGEAGYPSVIDGGTSIDRTDPTRNTFFFSTGGLGLADRDNYLVDNPRNLEMRAKYKELLAFMLGKAGYADPAAAAERVYELEKQFAAIGWDRALARDPRITTNRMTAGELAAMAGPLPLARWLEASGLRADDSVTAIEVPPTAEEIAAVGLTAEQQVKLGGGLPAMFALLRTAPTDDLKAWMAAHFMTGYAAYLPSEIDAANFAFYGQYLQGRQIQRQRWQRALSVTQGALGEGIGKIYVERHFPASSKAEMQELVANLRTAMAANLADLPWMTPVTRAAAREKLEAFTVKIGYPDKFETYDGMVVRPGQALENAVEATRWATQDAVRELREPVDRTKWLLTPQTVNAYYMPPANEIVFPAAILQPPYFNPDADPAVNYGAIGAVIGHEIGHGFDDKGSQYDGTGTLRNWWSDEDRAAFEELGERLVAQYDAVCPFDEGKTCHNGRLTLGENIGDLGGLSMAYQAYKLSLGGRPAPVIDGLTGDQRFFIAYAQAWREKSREEADRQQLESDPHSLNPARVNAVVRNFGPWYEAFGVTPDDELYLPPEERVHIW